MKIRPASNNQIKRWKKLLRGKYRKKEQQFIAEGLRCVEQIAENGAVTIREIIIEKGFDATSVRHISNLPVFELDAADFSAVTDTETPQGIAAVCDLPEPADLNHFIGSDDLIVAFDAVQDPGNLGTMIRTASWFGAGGLIFGEGTVDPFHPKVVRSTAGATGIIPWLKGDLHPFFDELEAAGKSIFLLDGSDQSVSINTVTAGRNAILVVGNEANGIDPALITSTRTAIRIDGNARHVESLNAAVALSIALYRFSLPG
jgi:RNA methyltransferase, TrmH family